MLGSVLRLLLVVSRSSSPKEATGSGSSPALWQRGQSGVREDCREGGEPIEMAEEVMRKNEVITAAAAEAEKSQFRRVCVFCGSSTGRKKCYQDAAVELGAELVSRKVDLVYGGGSVGLMGLVSQAVHEGGGHVLGIIPRTLMRKEITGESVGEVKVVAGMHQRKAEMSQHSDAFIALPGGYGTLEELLEVISWAQLGIHRKPVGLLNVDGYYDSLLALIDSAVDEGFIDPSQRHLFVSAHNAKDLVQKLEEYVPVGDGALVAKLRWEMEQDMRSTMAPCGYRARIYIIEDSVYSQGLAQGYQTNHMVKNVLNAGDLL